MSTPHQRSAAPIPRVDVRREDVCFTSAHQRCDGWLYRPQRGGTHPCVVMAHRIGGIRSAALPEFARRFAAAGFAALTFDYRHLGTSEGSPRGLIDIGRQRADLRAAVDYVCALDGIDSCRVALWGTSFGGGHVLATATANPRIAAAIIQNPFVDGRAAATVAMRAAGPRATIELAWRALRDEANARCRRAPLYVDLAGEPGTVALMTTPDAVAGFEQIRPPDPIGWEPAVPARIVLQLRADRPCKSASQITCPLLVAVCDNDAIAPPAPAIRVARTAPRGQLRRYPIGHFDLFTGHWLATVSTDQIAFLRSVLGN
ncbi:alpha/beta hydrolase [Mycolicibacterium fortuitum]|uniref:alpha/beta hydrolase n=1 Tax=Mycolicibacterium fortuitum TaxID=1766 RepID=UPI001F183ED9